MPFTYPPHKSHIFQVWGFLLSGILKKAKKYQTEDEALALKFHHLLRLFRGYEISVAIPTTRASWTNAGFKYERRDSAPY
jgi:hypothetical protein